MLAKEDMVKFVGLIQSLKMKTLKDVPTFESEFEEGVRMGKELAADELALMLKEMVE